MEENKKIRRITLFVLFIYILLLCIEAFFLADYLLARGFVFHQSQQKSLGAKLVGEGKKGVFIVCDKRMSMASVSPLACELSSLGYRVFLFDWPSVGKSTGKMSLDYKNSDSSAETLYGALAVFSQSENLSIEDIHIVAFGFGARAFVLAASKVSLMPGSVTLVAPEITLTKYLQFDILNFSKDGESESISRFFSYGENRKLHLVALRGDSVFSKKQYEAFCRRLEGENILAKKTRLGFIPLGVSAKSKSLIASVSDYVLKTDGREYKASLRARLFRPIEIISAGVLLLFVFLLFSFMGKTTPVEKQTPPDNFLKKKLLLWIGAVALGFFSAGVCYVAEASFPYYNMVRIGVFGTYGAVCVFFYCFSDLFFPFEASGFSFGSPRGLRRGTLVFCGLYLLWSLRCTMTGSQVLPSREGWVWAFVLWGAFFLFFYMDLWEKERFVQTKTEFLALTLVNVALGAAMFFLALLSLNTAQIMDYFDTFYLLVVSMLFMALLRSMRTSKTCCALWAGLFFSLAAFGGGMIFI